jgi:hypothetical protein
VPSQVDNYVELLQAQPGRDRPRPQQAAWELIAGLTTRMGDW